MAESLAIIGLASNIISFIDFGLKLASGTKTVLDSTDGTAPEIRELELVVQNVERLNGEIVQQKKDGQPLSPDEQFILDMAKECSKLADEIRKLMKKLMMRNGVRSKTLEGGRVAIQVMWKQKDIDRLRSRLESLDQMLRINITHVLQRDRHSAIMSNLRQFENLHRKNGIKYESKLDALREEIVRLSSQIPRKHEMRGTTHDAQLTSLKTMLDAFEEERRAFEQQVKVIESLYFVVLPRRWSDIPDAHPTTNEWLFDPAQTSFVDWLESQGGIYWINGKAGSGKSSLMKFASEHQRTLRALKEWASPAKLCTANYYFWNQGFEMQKSQLGLFQTLLYQILRNDPGLVPLVCPERRHYETWDVKDLKGIFSRIATHAADNIKFCFFIDGLDEYDGVEEDVVTMLKFLSSSANIKICASSRPRSIFEEFFEDKSRVLVIHDHTKDDIKISIISQLGENPKFQRLRGSEAATKNMAEQISNQAQGVWLWVFLVMRDLLHAVNRNEDLRMLLKIVDQFPSDLESYFERIIKRVKREYREEMAQIFLVMIHQIEPLPLFAISLLEIERIDPDYALNAPIRPIFDSDLSEMYAIWKSRVENRCGDLLVVNDGPHPICLTRPVDFLHLTVREYLQDNYYQQLKDDLPIGSEFDSILSLARITLYLLKSLPATDFDTPYLFKKNVIGLTDELLYYAHEIEKRSDSTDHRLVAIVDKIDEVNSKDMQLAAHWTHIYGDKEYAKGGNCNFLALTVQIRLLKYVQAKLQADPHRIHKSGRPLLDYALCPRRAVSHPTPHYSEHKRTSVDVDMVRLLLNHGADPNETMTKENQTWTVWTQFLVSCYVTNGKSRYREPSLTLHDDWYQVSMLLIQHGARSDCRFDDGGKELTMSNILNAVFGEQRAATLLELMEQEQQKPAKSSCVVS